MIENFYTVDAHRPRWTQSKKRIDAILEQPRIYSRIFHPNRPCTRENTHANRLCNRSNFLFSNTAAHQSNRTFATRRRNFRLCIRNAFLSSLCCKARRLTVNIRTLIIESLMILQKKEKIVLGRITKLENSTLHAKCIVRLL